MKKTNRARRSKRSDNRGVAGGLLGALSGSIPCHRSETKHIVIVRARGEGEIKQGASEKASEKQSEASKRRKRRLEIGRRRGGSIEQEESKTESVAAFRLSSPSSKRRPAQQHAVSNRVGRGARAERRKQQPGDSLFRPLLLSHCNRRNDDDGCRRRRR